MDTREFRFSLPMPSVVRLAACEDPGQFSQEHNLLLDALAGADNYQRRRLNLSNVQEVDDKTFSQIFANLEKAGFAKDIMNLSLGGTSVTGDGIVPCIEKLSKLYDMRLGEGLQLAALVRTLDNIAAFSSLYLDLSAGDDLFVTLCRDRESARGKLTQAGLPAGNDQGFLAAVDALQKSAVAEIVESFIVFANVGAKSGMVVSPMDVSISAINKGLLVFPNLERVVIGFAISKNELTELKTALRSAPRFSSATVYLGANHYDLRRNPLVINKGDL